MSLKEAIPELRRPFTPEAVKFKIQSFLGGKNNQPLKGVLCVAHLDARLVQERLNSVVPDEWESDMFPLAGTLACRLTVCGVSRVDVGEGDGKALASDALKRAAVHFGVGASLYALPEMKVWLNGEDRRFTLWQANGKWTGRIEDAGHAHLTGVYAQWLKQVGEGIYGKPYDHGDMPDAIEPEPEPATPPVPAPVVDEVIAEAAAAKDAGVKLGPIVSEIGVTARGGAQAAVRAMTPEQVERFRSLVAEAKSKLGATEVAS